MNTPAHARVAALIAIAILAFAFATTAARAQRETAMIIGQVVDARSRAPIPGAVVDLASARRPSVVVDSTGAFAHDRLAAGSHRIEARAVGYQAGAWVVLLAEGDTVRDLRLELQPREYELPAVEATAKPPPPSWGLPDFERRRGLGQGLFVTPDEIERKRPTTLGDILRTVPGVTTACDRVSGCYIRMLRAGRGCRAEILVDGVAATLIVQAETPATDMIAVEVYRSAAETPSEFVRLERSCGLIAIWTRAAQEQGPRD
jgi:hypothetical protein